MDPRIAGQRRGAIFLLIFFAVVFGVFSGVMIATGFDWIPHSAALTQGDDESGRVEPSDFLVRTQESFRDIVATVRPAVVSIQAQGSQTATMYESPFGAPDPFEWFFNNPDPFNRNPDRSPDPGGQPREYQVPQVSAASGFLVDPDGYILTSNHVVSGADEITVILEDGRQFDAQILGTDPDTDVAVLKIEDEQPLPYIPLGDSDVLQVGDWVMAIGNPFGNLAGTVTVGIVSAVGREYLNLPNEPYYQNFIQTDAAINLGNSGGPLVDIYGRAVGINTAMTAQGSGIGFAIPINMADFVYQSLLTTGEVVRGWVGITIQNMDPDLAESFGMQNTHGALVSGVVQGDPAEEAGLQEGDVILKVAGRDVTSVQSASRLIASLPIGEPAEFQILRDGSEMTIDVVPAQREPAVPARAEKEPRNQGEEEPGSSGKSQEYLGIEVRELTDNLISRYDLPEDATGVVVTYVDPSSPAFEKGLREGHVIVAINQQPVANLDDYRELMADAHRAWQENSSNVVLRFLVRSSVADDWVRQYMAVPFE